MSRTIPHTLLMLTAGLALTTACSKPEAQVVGHWTGSGQIQLPPTGNPQIDAQTAKGPQTLGCNLNIMPNHTYIENLQMYTIAGSWAVSDTTVTLTPKTIDGRGINAVKKSTQEAQTRMNFKIDLPGLNGPEQA